MMISELVSRGVFPLLALIDSPKKDVNQPTKSISAMKKAVLR